MMPNYQGLLAIVVSIVLGCNQTEQTTKSDENVIPSENSSCVDWAEFTINDFIISNNVWGTGTETNYEQCIYYKLNDSYNFV